MSRRAWTGILALGLVVLGSICRGDEAPRPDEARYDCGTKALFYLLQIEGRPTDPDRIVAALDEVAGGKGAAKSAEPGRSMKDLRDAAGRLGLTLDGVRWPEGGRIPDRPVIAFLDRKPHGHFVLIRPVGHSGKLVQVLDGEADPQVIDAARLVKLSQWTGLILEPRRANWPVRLGCVAVGLTLLALPWVRRKVRLGIIERRVVSEDVQSVEASGTDRSP